VFVSIKPLHVSVFFTTIFRGSSAVLCAVTIPPAELSGRNSNGTKHSGGPPEEGREKRPKHVGFYTYKHVFNILFVLNIEVCFKV
jgi:hypothetical protein